MRRYIILVSIAIVLSLIWYSVNFWSVHFKANTTTGTSFIFVPGNTGIEQLNNILEESGRIQNIKRFTKASRFYNLDGNIKPGRYKITAGMNNRTLVRTLRMGWQSPHNLTLSGNIRTPEKLASIISSKIESDSTSVLEVLKDISLIDSLGFTIESFPSVFLLNTYEIYWTARPKDLVIRFKKEYDKFWNQKRMEQASQLGLTPVQVATLASIVAEESNIAAEHPVIAGVYINRLKTGMPLQADPTIKFALNDPSVKRILFRHLEIDSPYNTYKNRGLPPGPITLPSPAVIDSVLNYQKHKYLYFCAKATLDGSHLFAATLAEHNRNARAYQAAISRLR